MKETRIVPGSTMELTRYHYHWYVVEESKTKITLGFLDDKRVRISGEKFIEKGKKYMTIEEDNRFDFF